MLFRSQDSGPISVTPVPPKTTPEQIHTAIVGAIRDDKLYGVICVSEAWTYFQKEHRDHTAFQLLDGEMKVSDLKAGDKTEALYLRMESKDGDCLVYLDRIIRHGDKVDLGEHRTINGEELKWFGPV